MTSDKASSMIDLIERVFQARALPRPPEDLLWMPAQLWVLWAVAMEIDDRQATRTGEDVCRSCGGRRAIDEWRRGSAGFPTPCFALRGDPMVGVVDRRRSIVAARPSPSWFRPPGPGLSRLMLDMVMERAQAPNVEPGHVESRWVRSSIPCSCEGPTRPVTKSLAREVLTVARARSMGDAPTQLHERWLVDLDKMEAGGWSGGMMPSGADVPAWAAKWWRAFMVWTNTGDLGLAAEILPDVLDELLTELEAKVRERRYKGRLRRVADRIRAQGQMSEFHYRILVEEIVCDHDVLVYTDESWPLEVPRHTLFVSWRCSATDDYVRQELEPHLPAGTELVCVPWVDGARERALAELVLSLAQPEIAERWPQLASVQWEQPREVERVAYLDEPVRLVTHWINAAGDVEMTVEAHMSGLGSVSVSSVSVSSISFEGSDWRDRIVIGSRWIP